MKLPVILMAIVATIVAIEIPEDFKPLEKNIFERLITPEDGTTERDIKSLFAQYILLAAMEAANTTESESESTQIVPTTESIRPEDRAKTLLPQAHQIQSTPQQTASAQAPQIIYIYVTAPTVAPQISNSDIKTKKPTKPPKTKKPKPPKNPHPSTVQVQQQQQPQQIIQVVPQPVYIQTVQQQPQTVDTEVDNPQQSIVSQSQSQPQPQRLPQQQIIVVQHEVPAPAPTTTPVPPTAAPVMIPVPVTTSVPILTPGAATPAPADANTTTTRRPGPSQEHVLNQVDKILQNVSRGNITGIVDQSLAIRTPMPVRNLVNGILNTIFCSPINRLLNRCRG